jgi:hypothetical protein
MWIKLGFDADLAAGDCTVDISPDPGVAYQLDDGIAGLASNELGLTFGGNVVGHYGITNGANDTFYVCFLYGDADQTGEVNGLDIAYISNPGNWGQAIITMDRARADVDRNGSINGLDIAAVSNPGNWGKTCP